MSFSRNITKISRYGAMIKYLTVLCGFMHEMSLFSRRISRWHNFLRIHLKFWNHDVNDTLHSNPSLNCVETLTYFLTGTKNVFSLKKIFCCEENYAKAFTAFTLILNYPRRPVFRCFFAAGRNDEFEASQNVGKNRVTSQKMIRKLKLKRGKQLKWK